MSVFICSWHPQKIQVLTEPSVEVFSISKILYYAYLTFLGCHIELISPLVALRFKKEKALSQKTFDEPVICAMIIAYTGYDCSGGRNIINNVQSRADPNQRLVRTFNINNAFTTLDENYRKDFRSHAKEKITLNDKRWKTIADLVRQLVGTAIPQPESDITKIRLDS